MSAEANKELVRKAYSDMNTLLESFADDATYTFFGKHIFARTFVGKQDIVNNLFLRMGQLLSEPIKLDIHNMIADGDYVVLEATGTAKTKDGEPYNNTYCIVLELRDGKIVRGREYLDTEIVSMLFGHLEG
jgi:ketosteroid isomerase-like protein